MFFEIKLRKNVIIETIIAIFLYFTIIYTLGMKLAFSHTLSYQKLSLTISFSLVSTKTLVTLKSTGITNTSESLPAVVIPLIL